MSNLLLVWGSVDLHQKGELFIYGMHISTKLFGLNSTGAQRPPRAGSVQPYKAARARPAAPLPLLTPGETAPRSAAAKQTQLLTLSPSRATETQSSNHSALVAALAQATSH